MMNHEIKLKIPIFDNYRMVLAFPSDPDGPSNLEVGFPKWYNCSTYPFWLGRGESYIGNNRRQNFETFWWISFGSSSSRTWLCSSPKWPTANDLLWPATRMPPELQIFSYFESRWGKQNRLRNFCIIHFFCIGYKLPWPWKWWKPQASHQWRAK